ncbi:MAG TPA: ChuX/HutX family heme-like substrate-binding protein, partial [bacterium]
AVKEVVNGAERRSIHVFDRDGTAVHKVYLEQPESAELFDRMVSDLHAANQSPTQSVQPLDAPAPERPDSDIDAAALRRDWQALKDTHEFFPMLGRHRVGRTQALRLAGPDLAAPVAPEVFPRLLEHAAATGLSIMVFVSSPGVVQIHTGPVKNIKPMGPWINVLDPDFNLHLRQDRVAHAWVVRKPTTDRTVTSLELFDKAGETIALIFGERKPGQPELEAWRATLDHVCSGAAR